jgi:hypothetical protein
MSTDTKPSFSFAQLPSFGVLALALILGIFVARWWYAPSKSTTTQEAQVLLEYVKNVTKLVTTEGYFSEIYSEKDTKGYYLIPSTKQAILKVKARVLMGYDLTGMKVEADQATRTLRVSNIPPPSILAIEPDVKLYSIENGYSNKFTGEEILAMNRKAVDTIRAQVMQSSLLESTRAQGQRNLESLTQLARSMGWQVAFENVEGFKD